MKHLGFLCLGLGIMSMAISLLGLVIGLVSKENQVRKKTGKVVACFVPLAIGLLSVGFWQVQAH